MCLRPKRKPRRRSMSRNIRAPANGTAVAIDVKVPRMSAPVARTPIQATSETLAHSSRKRHRPVALMRELRGQYHTLRNDSLSGLGREHQCAFTNSHVKDLPVSNYTAQRYATYPIFDVKMPICPAVPVDDHVERMKPAQDVPILADVVARYHYDVLADLGGGWLDAIASRLVTAHRQVDLR
jgi:hypothetical protein